MSKKAIIGALSSLGLLAVAMPSYAAELTAQERWAVVAYLGALRRSQAGSLADAPPDIQQKLRAEAGQ